MRDGGGGSLWLGDSENWGLRKAVPRSIGWDRGVERAGDPSGGEALVGRALAPLAGEAELLLPFCLSSGGLPGSELG